MKPVVRDDHQVRARLQVLEHFGDELVGAPVDGFDVTTVLCRKRGVVHRMTLIHEPPHHVLHAVGGFNDADEHIPLARIDAVEDHLGTVVESLVEILHERPLVHASFVERPGRFGPSERPKRAETPEEVTSERLGV